MIRIARWTFILTMAAFLLMTPSPQQAQANDWCRPLDTKYSGSHPSWLWLDDETVLFTVTYEAPTVVGEPIGQHTTTTYTYSFGEQRLTELPANPLVAEADNPEALIQTLRPHIRDLQVTLERPAQIDARNGKSLMEISPSGDYVVYPVAGTDKPSYRLALLESGREYDLAVTLRNLESNNTAYDQIDVLWAEAVDTFVVQGTIGFTNVYLPATLNTIEAGGITTRPLTDLKPLAGYDYVQFIVHGISPQGRYLVVDPDIFRSDDEWDFDFALIVDVDTEEMIDLHFNFNYRNVPPVAWLSDNIFRANTPLGIIDYSILTQSYTVVVSPEELETISSTGIAPNGAYMIGVRDLMADSRTLVACDLP